MFEKATKIKLRFKVDNGIIGVEDLWVLSLQNLDKLAKSLYQEIKEETEVSFISSTKKDSILQLRFELVKHVISVKLAEKEALKVKAANSERRSKILEILASKQDESLQAMSQEDLIKELESL